AVVKARTLAIVAATGRARAAAAPSDLGQAIGRAAAIGQARAVAASGQAQDNGRAAVNGRAPDKGPVPGVLAAAADWPAADRAGVRTWHPRAAAQAWAAVVARVPAAEAAAVPAQVAGAAAVAAVVVVEAVAAEAAVAGAPTSRSSTTSFSW